MGAVFTAAPVLIFFVTFLKKTHLLSTEHFFMKEGKPAYKFTISSVSTPFHKIGKTYEEITEICRESGFAGIEGSVPLFANQSEGKLQKIGKLFQDAGLQIETFHLPHVDPVKDDIATLYEVDREKVESNMKRIIDQAVILGSSIGILHPTTRKDHNTNVEGIDRLLGQAGKTLDALLRHGEQYNFKIAIENMLPYTGERLGCKVEHLEKILSRYDHPNLGFCFDTGHALVSAGEKAMELFRFMKDRVIAFHLDDNAGDRDSHLAPGHGRFFWKEFFAELREMNFQNTICVEAPPFAYGPDYSIEAWKTLHEELRTLAEKNP